MIFLCLYQEFTQNLNGFSRLFERFIDEQGREVEWSKISPPPSAMVCFSFFVLRLFLFFFFWINLDILSMENLYSKFSLSFPCFFGFLAMFRK